MPSPKPLLPNEIPKELREFIDFDSQDLRRRLDGHKRMNIGVTCSSCGNNRIIRVSTIRTKLKNKTWSGLCVSCNSQNLSHTKPLLPPDVPQELRKFVDFDSQHVRARSSGRRWLYIEITCPDCLRVRTIEVSSIKQRINNGAWTAICGRCWKKNHAPKHSGPDHTSWRGGRYVSGRYILRHRASFSPRAQSVLEPMFNKVNLIAEHRAMMALLLGRPLVTEEHVHHINGDRWDNRPENLRLANHHDECICPNCGWPMKHYQKSP